MNSLYELAKELQIGDYLAWQAEDAKPAESTFPKRITSLKEDVSEVEVRAEGQQGGEYYFIVDQAGNSQSFYVEPSGDEIELGEIIFAEIAGSEERVAIKSGYFGSRK